MEAQGKKPPGITVDGREYELPQFHTITLDEERVLFVLADCLVRDFIPEHPEWSEDEKTKFRQMQSMRIRDPNFKKALAVITLRREEPHLSDEERMAKAGKVNALEADIAMLWSDDEDPPQTSQKQPERRSDTSEHSSSTDSGRDTKNSSDQEDRNPAPTGTSESGTSSRPSLEAISVS